MTRIYQSSPLRVQLSVVLATVAVVGFCNLAYASVVDSTASLMQFGANCLAQGGKFTSDGNGGGGTCTKGNVVVYCTKATPTQGPKASGIVCSVKSGGGSAAKLLRKLVKLPTSGDGRNNSQGTGTNSSGSNTAGSNNAGNGNTAATPAPSGPKRGDSNGCSGGVC
jgi:hypothetical protein